LSEKRLLCELIGTATLILVGCGAISIGGFGPAFPVGILPVALAFGLAVMAMAYAIGPGVGLSHQSGRDGGDVGGGPHENR
jgi:aquaporin Z